MRIEQLPGLEPGQISRLRGLGITHCRQLLRASRGQERFLDLVTSTELRPETLHSAVQRAELGQIRGIGPTTLIRLFEVGVDSLAALATWEPDALQAELQQVTARPPNLAVIEHWILQARQKAGWGTEPISEGRFIPQPRDRENPGPRDSR